MSKKMSKEITQGLLKSRLTEKKVDRSILKMQKSQKKLLFEIKNLIDSNNDDQARLLAGEIAQSRKAIKKLGKLKFYVRGINFFFKDAQLHMIKGESLENIAKALIKVNKIMSIDSLDETFMAIENEMEELNLNLEQADQTLEVLDDPIDEDEYVDNVIKELSSVKKDEIIPKINDLVNLNKLIPPIPKFDKEMKEEDDFDELKD